MRRRGSVCEIEAGGGGGEVGRVGALLEGMVGEERLLEAVVSHLCGTRGWRRAGIYGARKSIEIADADDAWMGCEWVSARAVQET